MIVKRTIPAHCRACGRDVTCHEYVGLEGGLYHSHICQQLLQFLVANPDADMFVFAKGKDVEGRFLGSKQEDKINAN